MSCRRHSVHQTVRVLDSNLQKPISIMHGPASQSGKFRNTDIDDMLAVVTVIIPVHNEEESLPLVLGDLPPVGHVIVVNNASTDDSAAIARRMQADVVDESERGYGSACLAGIAHVQQRIDAGAPAPEFIAFLDGDYSDYPEELASLLQVLVDEDLDLVLGSRLMGKREQGAMPPQSIFGNIFACFLMRVFWGARFTDLGPFRLIRWPALQQLGMQDRNFGWTVEMQVKAVHQGLQVREIPVRYRRRVGVSKISGTVGGTIRAGYKILFTIARYRWRTLWAK